jgi:hypothetical protein
VLLAAIAAIVGGSGHRAGADWAPPPAGWMASGHEFSAAVERLARSRWAAAGLGTEFVANSVALLNAEAMMFADTVTAWETQRYWAAS